MCDVTEQSFVELTISRGTIIRLPRASREWSAIHGNDRPFMLYEGEEAHEYVDGHGARYILTSFGRIYSLKKQDFVKSISGEYVPTLFKKLFSAAALNNSYAHFNIDAISPTNYYRQHREERLAYQRAYRDNNLEKVKAIEKRCRANRNARMTEEEKEAAREKKRLQAAARRARIREQKQSEEQQEQQEQQEQDNAEGSPSSSESSSISSESSE